MVITNFKVVLDGYEIGINGKMFIFLTRRGTIISLLKSDYLSLNGVISELEGRKYADLGLLVDSHEEELLEVVNENENHDIRQGELYLPVMPSMSCQLNCGYCGQAHKNRSATDYAIDRVEAKVIESIKYKDIKSIELGFFGGEPFLGFKWIERLSSRLNRVLSKYPYIKLSSKIISNGISIDKRKLELLCEDLNLKKIEITLDGTKKIHDSQRGSINGRSYFDRIIASLRLIKEFKSIECVIRCNVGLSNHEHIPRFIDFLTEQGFSSFCNLYFAPIHSWGNSANNMALQSELFSYKSLCWKLYLVSKGWNIGFLPKRKYGACIATSKDQVIIDPNGEEFDCTEMPLVRSYKDRAIRYKNESNIIAKESSRSYESFNSSVKSFESVCSSCFAFPVCGGACPKEWDEGRIPCPSFKYTASEALKSAIITKEQG